MRFRGDIWIVLGAALALPAARAQDVGPPPDDAQRDRILRRVEDRLREDDERIRRDIERLLDEEFGSAYLGVAAEALGAEEREALRPEGGVGVRVAEVASGSPAEQAGLLRGDVILRVGREEMRDPAALRAAVEAYRPGESTPLTFRRDGTKHRVAVVFGVRRSPAAGPHDPAGGRPGGGARPGPRDALRRDALRERIRELLQTDDPARLPRGARAPLDDFDADALIDDLFSGRAGREDALQTLIRALRASPDGAAALEFLRDELRSFAPSLRRHTERGGDGRWRLRRDSSDFLRAWLEDEMARGGPRRAKPKEGELSASSRKVRVGILAGDLTPEARPGAGLAEGRGFSIVRLMSESPADRAGLRAGDIVVKLDGQDATEALLRSRLDGAKPGDGITFTILRAEGGGAAGAPPKGRPAQTQDVRVILEAAP